LLRWLEEKGAFSNTIKEVQMYKKILAPLDGSELSECTLEHLKAVATGCQVPEVVLLRVVEPFHTTDEFDESWRAQAEERAMDYARDYVSKVAESLKKDGITAETVVVFGQTSDHILDYAKKNDVDLIVMSTHGRSGVSRWVLGSVADRVVRHAAAAVLTVRPAACRVE
jgi:nucleotide-binding universal stress UspA family protein